MIEAYLRRLDALLGTSALVHDVEIVRRSIRDTEFEKVIHYRYRVLLANGDLIEMTERAIGTSIERPDSKALTIASGIVWVRPWKLPANMIVAPNSPSARDQARTIPAANAGAASGNVTSRTTADSAAPKVERAQFTARDALDLQLAPGGGYIASFRN